MAKAVVSDLELGSDEQRLLGIANKIRLSAPADVVQEAEKLIRQTIAIWLKPPLDFRATASEALVTGESLLVPVGRAFRRYLDELSMGYLRVMELSFSASKIQPHAVPPLQFTVPPRPLRRLPCAPLFVLSSPR